MVERTAQVLRYTVPVALVIAARVATVAASDEGRIAAARVTAASYRHVLDDVLYAHDGDNRGFGPEHDLARASIAERMAAAGLAVELDPFYCSYNCTGVEYYNVVGTKLGVSYPDQEFVIGAHYDSVDNPGADDNASGVALILEAARALGEFESDYTIRFIAFDREEQGLHGSREYALEHITDDILGMISADMVAYNGGFDSVDIFCGDSPNLQVALSQAVATYGDGLTASHLGLSGGSDHYWFGWAGFEACLYIEKWGNPFYHTQLDNVDTPEYIDYDYAARNTRVIVGYLVDNAGVHVDIPDGDYDDDGDVDQDDYDAFVLCFTGEGVPPDDPECDFFDFLSDGDVDCDDLELLRIVWTGPGDAPLYWICDLPAPEVISESGRCVTITPRQHSRSLALLVTGDPDDARVSCLSQYVQPDGRLGARPVYQMSATWGTVTACDELIIPDASYGVQCDYGEESLPVFSPVATATTAVWGDTVGYPTGNEWPPPDGSVDIIDVVAILDGFRGSSMAPPLHWVDLVGLGETEIECGPDGSIDIIDAVGSLDAFKGMTFLRSTGCLGPCAP